MGLLGKPTILGFTPISTYQLTKLFQTFAPGGDVET